MKIMALHRLSKQDIINFVVAHPKLITLLAGIGITITFSLVSRFSFESAHLAFAQGAEGKFPLDQSIPLEKFPLEKVQKENLASIALASCENCVEEPPGE